MNNKPTTQPLEDLTLDPDDWDGLRDLGHRALDDMVDYLKSVRSRPAWSPIPEASRKLFEQDVPFEPGGREEVYAEVKNHILPYPTGNIHPRFWSWVGGTGTPTQLIADLVISAMNSGSLGFDEASSTYVELQLLNWLKRLLDYPEEASGLLVSGGSMANLVGLSVARSALAGYDVRADGVDVQQHPRMRVYASTETHSSVRKAVELLGLGTRALKLIPVKSDFTIDVEALREAIEADGDNGLNPAVIVANVGTVNTGAIDPLNELADLAQAHGLWLHADGAFGAVAKLSRNSRELVSGLERSDSVAFDLHKWLYVQYDCGCVFVKTRTAHKDTFSVVPEYLRHWDRGLASGPTNFSDYGVQLSRSFKALRAWVALKTEGVNRYSALIEQNIQQAKYLTQLVEASEELQLMAPTHLNIVNFRFATADATEQSMDDLNAEILMRLHETGTATPSSTTLNGRFSLRVAICNHRSRRSDFDALVEAVVAFGKALAS